GTAWTKMLTGGVMRQIGRSTALSIMVVATGIAVFTSEAAWRAARADRIQRINARVVAVNIPGASAISQIGTFVSGGTLMPGGCANPSPIPTKFSTYTLPGKVLDPNRILVGSRSAPRPHSGGLEGSFLSIDPSGKVTLVVP